MFGRLQRGQMQQRPRFPGSRGRRHPTASVRAGPALGGGVDSQRDPTRFSAQTSRHRGGKQRKPNAASEQLFSRLSDEYHIRLACDQCISQRRDALSGECLVRHGSSATRGHMCTEHKLLLQSKAQVRSLDNWTLVRSRPWSYEASDDRVGNPLCDYATLGRPCPDGNDCACPHSSVESDIWESAKIDLSLFIDDVRWSSLVTRCFVARVCKLYDGGFLNICRICYFNTQPPQLVQKRPHVVKFHCGHTGANNNLLCFQANDGSQTIPIVAGDAVDHGIVSECLVFKRNYQRTEQEIEQESKRWKQQQRTSAKPKASSTAKVHRFTEDDCYVAEWYPPDIFAKQHRIREMGIIDEYESAQSLVPCEQNADNSGFIVKDKSKKMQYYEFITEDRLYQLLGQQSDVYKRCIVNLKSGDTAECEVIGAGSEEEEEVDRIIEVRGRRNCGQCFSGDEVLVEISEREGKEQKVPLGKVIGVFKHGIDCRSQVFVCTYLTSSLVIPICGTAPTIRINDFLIIKKYWNLRHELVEVYDDQLKLRHIARLPKDTSKVMFVVRLLAWNTRCALPLGRVTRILKTPETLAEELKLLNIVYRIPWLSVAEKPKRHGIKSPVDVKAGTRSVKITRSVESSVATIDRSLYPSDDDYAITIDSVGTKCFDDAFTVEHKPGSTDVIIGVHITDVTERVAKGDRLDMEAARMVDDWYTSKCIPGVCPARRLFHDFRDECSLRAGSGMKSVVSMIFRVNEQTGLILESSFKRFRIRIRANLDYRETQSIINRYYADDAFAPGSIESKVITLHRVTIKMRNRRLETAAGYFDDDKKGRLDNSADARRLVEELSLTANCRLAEELLLRTNENAQCLPIRRQMAPSDEAIASFQRRNRRVVAASLFFARPDWLPPDIEANGPNVGTLCNRETSAILNRLSARDPSCKHLLVKNCLPVADISYEILKERIIGTEILHPEHHLAMIAWFRIQRRAEYVCSSGADVNETRHFQLNFPAYVQFTSPLRRHLDVVAHRILKGVLDGVDVAPYTTDEIRQLCQNANRLHRTKKGREAYTDAVKELDFLQATSKDSRMLTCFVIDFDDAEIVLSFPAFKQRSSDFKISYRNISVRTLPDILDPGRDPAARQSKITWEMRIYDTQTDKTAGRTNDDMMKIKDIDNGVQSCEYKRAVERQTVSDGGVLNPTPPNCVTSEMRDGLPIVVQHVRFCMTFIRGMTLEIQLGKYRTTREGRRELQIDLVSLPNRVHDFCILHHRQPVQCLAHIAYQRSMKTFYRSLEQYRQIWLPILSMESATNAVSTDISVVCRNVPLRIYSCVWGTDGNGYNAHLSLEKRFCDERKLTFLLNKCRWRQPFSGGETESIDDFLCIRYSHPSSSTSSSDSVIEPHWNLVDNDSQDLEKTTTADQGEEETSDPSSSHVAGKTWIAHGTITSCALEHGMVDIKCRLTQVNFRLSQNHALFWESSNGCRCTVEFMPKTLTDRRREAAVRKENMSQLCRDILLNMVNQRPINVADGLINHFDLLNDEQRTAIGNARNHRFYLIHGPPGTGKTVAGVHLANCFVQSNKIREEQQHNGRRQVLYCGPSNSAVDVAACKLLELLTKFSSSVKIIRIYSQTCERRAYPVPRDLLETSLPAGETTQESVEEPAVREHTLHHRIRSEENPHSHEIRQYDARFRANLRTPWNVTNPEIEEYEGVVRKAEALEISAADVIFCTCISSASDRVKRNARVRQVIIDEAGMCAEPDCLVPLTSHLDVEQVVLVGDHLQLQPIAVNYDAKRLGLGRSLFERHSQNNRVLTVLRMQYRMHDSICRFPSDYFYKGSLVTASNPASSDSIQSGRLWPADGQRIVFCHVVGEEENQKVATAEGNLFSKSNEKEQVHVVKILRHLVTTCNIPMQSISVVSQYKAQCSQLRRRLQSEEFGNVHVSTVVASQGKEWDYLILSTVRSLSKYEIDPRPQRNWISEHLGTAADPHQINVALTRAKHGLIILGNKNLLGVCPMWRALIDDYRDKLCLVNAREFPP